MATNTDRIDQLTEKCDQLRLDVGRLQEGTPESRALQRENEARNAELANRLSVVESQVGDLRQEMNRWHGRFWALVSLMLVGLLALVANLILLVVKLHSQR